MSLKLTSPHMKGEQVEQAQRKLNRFLYPYGRKVEVDGDYGEDTAQAVYLAKLVLGFPAKSCRTGYTPPLVKYMASPDARPAAWKARGRVRWANIRRRRAKAAKRLPRGAKIVRWAERQVGTVESPPGSNRGPAVSTWQREANGSSGYPWCGAFVIAAYRHGGGKNLPSSWVYTPSIYYQAQRGEGCHFVRVRDCLPGDVVLFHWNSRDIVQHVGIVQRNPKDGTLYCIEGNTSPDRRGSQDNGGGVYVKHRTNGIRAVVRVNP